MQEITFNHKENPMEIIEAYKEFLSKNKDVYILGGELSPSFYERMIKECYNLLDRIFFHFICGPYIAVEDKPFRKYHDIHNNHLGNWWYAKRKDNWWKDHPVFKMACEKNNAEIYIIKKRSDDPHFCVGTYDNDIFVEEPHDELRETKVYLHRDDVDLTQGRLKAWHEIKDQECYRWNKEVEVKFLFKPVSIFKREQQLEEKLKKEFSHHETI